MSVVPSHCLSYHYDQACPVRPQLGDDKLDISGYFVNQIFIFCRINNEQCSQSVVQLFLTLSRCDGVMGRIVSVVSVVFVLMFR